MPIHQHPVLRAREEAEETAGLVVTLDSDGITRIKNQESAGLRIKQVPVEYDFYFNGQKTRAK